jgi:hypothetical protein
VFDLALALAKVAEGYRAMTNGGQSKRYCGRHDGMTAL